VEQREIGRLGRSVSVVGLGTWQLGADWGHVDPAKARAVLESAVDQGVTFFDTADVYGDGRSEQLCGELLARHPDVLVATKMGRRGPQTLANYSPANFLAWNERSRANLGADRIDLVQLHCPPDDVYASDEVFAALDALVDAGHIAAYGVSVETCEQAMRAISRAGVGIIARVPLASGLLSGRFDEHTTFAPDDHRTFNRHGEAFDVGETFSGVPYETGLAAVVELRKLLDPGMTLAQFALRWVIDQPAVSTVIPGASSPDQVLQNASVATLAPLGEDQLAGVRDIYDRLLREHVHSRW
jgi:aryl-alcohol dehydrogenase-like predicted oxidoreductase